MNRMRLVGLIGAALVLTGGLLLVIINHWMLPGLALMAMAVIFAFLAVRAPLPPELGDESRDIGCLPEERRRALLRGTSMHLRDMRYRYSVRYDHTERACFNADVNGVHLGFVPVIILDNMTDRQGYGYVAFPFDGSRWRGPGLPCGGGPEQALEHAARCVAPLDETENE